MLVAFAKRRKNIYLIESRSLKISTEYLKKIQFPANCHANFQQFVETTYNWIPKVQI